MSIYFYLRLGTPEEPGPRRFNRQEASLRQYAQLYDYIYNEQNVYKETKTSGRRFADRPEWMRLETVLKSGDTIVCKDISRFSGAPEECYRKYKSLLNMGINLVFLDNPTVCSEYINRMIDLSDKRGIIAPKSIGKTIELLLCVELDRIEHDRILLQRRLKHAATSSEKKPGHKLGQIDKMTPELESDILLYLNDHSFQLVEIMTKHDISRNTLKKYMDLISSGAYAASKSELHR